MANHMSATGRLNAAYTKPIYQRCDDISRVIEETSIQELHNLFPSLLANIFGVGPNQGWGLARLERRQGYDFSTVRQLLNPNGSIFRLIYKLMNDPYHRYEFPLSCIPPPSRHALEEGGMPLMYMDKIQPVATLGGAVNHVLVLNAFQYYFFHFAYFLVGPRGPKTSVWVNPSEALYPTILEDYLYYFLPLDGKAVPAMPNLAPPVRSPLQTHTQRSPMMRGMYSSPGMSPLHSSSYALSPAHTAMAQDVTEQETWRTQTILQIFVEFWMNQTSLENERYTYSSQVTPDEGLLSDVDPLDIQYHLHIESLLPSVDHVRVVRMLVKHLHYFTNSSRADLITSPYQSVVVSPMENFKRLALPQLVQKRLYSFLRHGFERWPLDSSFRLLLETWLSFLQPWRYEQLGRPGQPDVDAEQRDRPVPEKWNVFVEDNLLFYTILLQDLLPRFFRLDLMAPKNAYMLFRFSKVFALTNLDDMISVAETSLVEPTPRLTRVHPGVTQDIGASYLSPSNRAARLNMQFVELEGPTFRYMPMFSQESAKLVKQLLILSQQALDMLHQSLQRSAPSADASFLKQLFSWPDTSGYYGDDENSVNNSRKAESHLNSAIDNLCKVFRQPRPEPGHITNGGGHCQSLGADLSQPPEHVNTDDGRCLTPLGRYQLMNGLRRFHIGFSGDPDLQPIRSYECTFLVRMLHNVASYINREYRLYMEDLTKRTDFLARLQRQFLYEIPPSPSTSVPVQSLGVLSPGSSPDKACQLQSPRLRLRWLASYHVILLVLLLYLLAYVFLHMDVIGFVLCGTLSAVLWAGLKALLLPRQVNSSQSRTKWD